MSRAHRPKDVVVKRVLRPRSWTVPAWTPVLAAFLLGVAVGFLVAPRTADTSVLERSCLTQETLLFPIQVSAREQPYREAYLFIYQNQTSGATSTTDAAFDDTNTTSVNEAVPPLSIEVLVLYDRGHLSYRQLGCAQDFLRQVTP